MALSKAVVLGWKPGSGALAGGATGLAVATVLAA